MITEKDGLRIQTAEEGMLLYNGEIYAKEIYLGDGAQPWQEIPDDGQMEPIKPEEIS